MYKKSSSIWTIVFKSLVGFFENLPIFFKCFLPPILWQILACVFIGIGVVIVAAQALGAKGGIGALLAGVLVEIIGIVILCKAIWDLLIRMGGVVLISKQIIENEPLCEAKYYIETFKNRTGYVKYLLIAGFLIPLLPIALIFYGCFQAGITGDKTLMLAPMLTGLMILLIMCPFLILTFQSFVLNPKLTPFEAIVKGMKLSGGKYLQSWGIMILHGIVMFAITGLFMIFAKMVSIGTGIEFNTIKLIVQLLIQFLQGYSLLCFTWWYLRLEKETR